MNSAKLQDTRLIYRNLLLFHSFNNELSEKESKKIPFKIISKRIKYQQINLTKKVKDVYSESYKTLIKEINDAKKKRKDIPCS